MHYSKLNPLQSYFFIISRRFTPNISKINTKWFPNGPLCTNTFNNFTILMVLDFLWIVCNISISSRAYNTLAEFHTASCDWGALLYTLSATKLFVLKSLANHTVEKLPNPNFWITTYLPWNTSPINTGWKRPIL